MFSHPGGRHAEATSRAARWPECRGSPLQSIALHEVARRLGAAPMAVALAWLLRRSPNILLIPGTSSVAHLRENVAAAALTLPAGALAVVEAIGR
jgi:pyridoxine 4-dehydrogenase